jgi:hypothetical protein
MPAIPHSDNLLKQLDDSIAVVRKYSDNLLADPGLLHLQPRVTLSAAGPTGVFIEAVTQPGNKLVALPATLDGFTLRVRPATAQELVEGFVQLSSWEGIAPETVPAIGYVPPPASLVSLKEQHVNTLTCHVGPDSGWPTLQPFLEGTQRTLTLAMYEFYAPHILETVTKLGQNPSNQMDMILQVDKNDRTAEATLRSTWKNRLTFVPASVKGPNRIFNNSYHTKVAVRDSAAFWMSSGNWSPASQPTIPPGMEKTLYSLGNREWHLLIEHKPLAEMYEKFIRYDMEQANHLPPVPAAAPTPQPDLLVPMEALLPEATLEQPHPFAAKKMTFPGAGIRVKPLMSPDNYAQGVLDLIQGAEHSLYLQFSYINVPFNERFDQIIAAITDKMNAVPKIDVKVMVSRNQKPDSAEVLLTRRGWKASMFRQQTSRMHNKGILIDGKITVVGSNNWSSDGTQYNRDTSLVLFSEDVYRYFADVFLFDWTNLSKPIGSGSPVVPEVARMGETTPLGMVRIPYQAWFDE